MMKTKMCIKPWWRTSTCPELLDKINQIIVAGGHALLKNGEGVLRGRCDSFVVETDVHFPTDINLLWDALRKAITLTAHWCEEQQLSDWQQYSYNLRQLKRLMRSAQNKSAASLKHDKTKSTHKLRKRIRPILTKPEVT